MVVVTLTTCLRVKWIDVYFNSTEQWMKAKHVLENAYLVKFKKNTNNWEYQICFTYSYSDAFDNISGCEPNIRKHQCVLHSKKVQPFWKSRKYSALQHLLCDVPTTWWGHLLMITEILSSAASYSCFQLRLPWPGADPGPADCSVVWGLQPLWGGCPVIHWLIHQLSVGGSAKASARRGFLWGSKQLLRLDLSVITVSRSVDRTEGFTHNNSYKVMLH